MRAYFFTNYYMSSIQKGIQSLHCVADMFSYYEHNDSSPSKYDQLLDWANYHKTAILLNGGNSKDLKEMYDKLHFAAKHTYPYGKFCEDEQSLNNAVTCVGILVPEKVYLLASVLRKAAPDENLLIRNTGTFTVDDENGAPQQYNVSPEDIVIADLLLSCPLAN